MLFMFFFFKQKTAYEMRISDWSSDVCSSDLVPKGWTIPVDADFFVFEATAEWTDVATRYVIGLAALISGDPVYAERLLQEVERKIRSGQIGRASCRERVCQYV